MAKGQRLKPEQIVALLRKIDFLTTNRKTLAQACKEVGAVEQSYYCWRNSRIKGAVALLLQY